MATTGTYLADPNLAELADEAFERAGVSLQDVGGEHIRSFRRSCRFVFSRWSNKGPRQWTFQQVIHTTTVDENEFTLPAGAIDVQTAVLKRGNVETEMYAISRHDYQVLSDKTIIGRPDRFFVDRRRDTETATRVRVQYWLAAENNTDQIVMQVWFQLEDPGNAQNTLDIPFRWQDAIAADLAARMAQKYKPEKYGELRVEAEALFQEADNEDQESAPMVLSVQYGRRYGRR